MLFKKNNYKIIKIKYILIYLHFLIKLVNVDINNLINYY